jgi:hypothetical protein
MESRYLQLCNASGLAPNPGIRDGLSRGARANLIVLEPAGGATLLTDDDLVPIGVIIKETSEKSFRLKFGGQRIGDRGASMLASLLQVHDKLLAFSLPSNQIKDEGASAFGASLASCAHSPQLIDLSGNLITDHGAGLLLKGCSLRSNGSLTLLLAGNPTTPLTTAATADAILTAPFVISRLAVEHVTDGLRAAATETGVTILSEVAQREERLARVESACAFPSTQESKLRKLTARVAELEKQLGDAAERETAAAARMVALEEQVVKEQEQCLKILRQCQKMQSN